MSVSQVQFLNLTHGPVHTWSLSDTSNWKSETHGTRSGTVWFDLGSSKLSIRWDFDSRFLPWFLHSFRRTYWNYPQIIPDIFIHNMCSSFFFLIRGFVCLFFLNLPFHAAVRSSWQWEVKPGESRWGLCRIPSKNPSVSFGNERLPKNCPFSNMLVNGCSSP